MKNCDAPSVAVEGVRTVATLVMLSLSGVLSVNGCAYDDDSLRGRTHNRLEVLARATRILSEKGCDVSEFADVKQLVEALQANNLIMAEDIDRGIFEKDAWGRPLFMKSTKQSAGTRLCVYSAGKNGIDDGGRGDDLVIEVAVMRRRP
jgi:hypothetical protein